MTDINAQQLLISLSPSGTESARGYALRLAKANAFPNLFQARLANLHSSAKLASELAGMPGPKNLTLHARACWHPASHGAEGLVYVGHARLARHCLRATSRAVCPDCLRESGVSLIEWEVRACKACPRHKCWLVTKCPNCGHTLTWSRTDADTCLCGQSLTAMRTAPAPKWVCNLARLFTTATQTSLQSRFDAAQRCRNGPPLRLDKLLLLLEVINRGLLAQFLGGELLRQHGPRLSVAIIRDRGYRDYLWDEVFLHLADRPMEMAKLLLPGNPTDEFAQNFSALIDRLYLPSALVEYARGCPDRRLMRQVLDRIWFARHLHGPGPCHLNTVRTSWNDGEDPDEILYAPDQDNGAYA